MTLSTVNIM